MKLRGILDLALGNFLCLRGYARMGDLYRISEADKSYQRDLISKHRDEMVAFLNGGDFMFFPELTLGTFLEPDDGALDKVHNLFESLIKDTSYKENFSNLKLQYSVTTAKGRLESRGIEHFRRTTIDITDDDIKKGGFKKFARIDGNHRLSATLENTKFENINIPFCLIIFRSESEFNRLGRALFHNINYKQIPLTMEQNLKLILEDESLFDDDTLKNEPSFGWPYYLSRKVLISWDLSMLPAIKNIIEPETGNAEKDKTLVCKRTFLLNTFKILLKDNLLKENKAAGNTFKGKLSRINTIYEQHNILNENRNIGLISAFVYYALKSDRALKTFTNWVIENHIYAIEKSEASELIKIFDSVLESRHRTIFVSMQFSEKTNPNYKAIENAVDDVNKDHKLDLKIQQIRIDKLIKGHSYKIDEEILQLVEDSGLLLADLSLGNKNVYHEIGYLMGLNKGGKHKQDNFILLHNKRMTGSKFNKDVGFNLKAHQVLIADGTDDLRSQLKKQIEKYYHLSI